EQSERLAAGTAANLELATGRYQGGAAPLLEVVDAQAADASARIAVVRARLNLALSRAQLLAATGRLERLVD
nr:TolC family protein [Deltaproteobacteria bacterium]